jgi:putative intracellular protease/amidase
MMAIATFDFHDELSIAILPAVKSKHILIIVANPAVSTTLGWPVGFWASELIHPYDALTKAGHRVTIASPKGGKVELDGYSDPRDASGYSKDDALSLAYLNRPDFVKLLENTPSVGTLRAADFDAIIVAGGQSPMFTFRSHAPLQKLFLAFFNAGKPSAALCHGTCLLLDLKNGNGAPLISGKKMTGFANSEEDFADQVVGQKVMPFRIEDEARKLGANFVTAPAFQPFAVRDGNLITGQQQHSGHEVAKLVLQTLEEKP